MGNNRRRLALLFTLTLTTAAFADAVKQEGVIVSRSENVLHIRTKDGPLNVVVAPDTPIKEAKGLALKPREAKTLIPGLIIQVQGDQQGDTVTAAKIQYKDRDFRAAVATRAGTASQFAQAANERAEMRAAIIGGQEYAIRDEVTVHFTTGSAVIDATSKQPILQLAHKAPSFGNYRISVLGFADPRGSAEANERLSRNRAAAVSNYLRQSGAIQPARVLSPSAMGEGTAAPGEAAPASNDDARRVVVRVVTPKAQLTQ